MGDKDAKSTNNFFGCKMAVEVSFVPAWGAAPLGSAVVRWVLKLDGFGGTVAVCVKEPQ
jgi:hypothetical protein